MAKQITVTLDRTFLINGQFYGPGVGIAVPDQDTADALTAKQKQMQASVDDSSAPPASESGVTPAATIDDVNAQIAALEATRQSMLTAQKAADPFAGIPAETVSSLKTAGFVDADTIRAALDADLQKVTGVGPLVVTKLRDNTAIAN